MNSSKNLFRILIPPAVALIAAGLWWSASTSRRDHSVAAPPATATKQTVPEQSPLPASTMFPSEKLAAVTPALEIPAGDAAPIEARKPVTAVTEFDSWLNRYLLAATPGEKATLLAEGEGLAAKRRDFLYDLAKDNPEAALAAAVPMASRGQLPESVLSLLEEHVSARGFYGVLIADNFETNRRDVRREFVANGKTYDTFVFGSRLTETTRDNVALQGPAFVPPPRLASKPHRPRFVPDPRPIRLVQNGERTRPVSNDELCLVSGQRWTAKATGVLGEKAGQIEPYCAPSHLDLANQRLAADSGGSGSGGDLPPTAQESWTQGPKTCLFMRVAFPDDPSEPITEDGAYAMMDTVNQWYIENSYDTTSIIPTVTPLLMLPQPKAWYSEQGTGTLLRDSRTAAREAGFDTDNYHWDVLRHGNVPGFNYGGLGYVRGKGSWLQSSSAGVAVHELGHNYGLWHANFWTAPNDSVIGPGSNSEYGNSFDTMGAASAGNNQFNAAFKSQLDWMPEAFIETIVAGGTHRLYTFDIPNLTSGRNYALKVKKNYDRNYWIEFRQKFASNRWFLNGVSLNWDPWNNGVVDSAGGTHLLDTTPGSPDGKNDGSVLIGRTFTDPSAGVHITPVARGNLSPENWIDVVVNVGEFPGNRAPVAALSADRTSVAANAAVNFIANATDADGDTLAYQWDFGDANFGPNSQNVSKSWSAAGEYTVRCTVSDMKGGVFSRHLVITVGSPTTFRISGRITTDSGAPLEGVRVHNGLSGTGYRGTFTDSEGYYVVANNAASSHTLSAAKYGYAFSRLGWNNPVTSGNASGLNWSATADPRVSIAAVDAVAGEAASNQGRFTLTRTGATDAALVVKLNRGGTATLASDYTPVPPIAGSPLQLTIPVGATSLNVDIFPQSDASGEGPETVILTLQEDPAYVLGGLAEATVTILDDDAAGLPTVDVSASSPGALADNLATESGSDAGVFAFTRTGSVANELTVFYAVTGTATAGVDYTALPGVVTFPAGQSVTSLPFTVIDDLKVETNETVIVTVLANAAYAGAGDSSSIIITDDDPQTVTITSPDDTAREAGAGAGVFTITRQGNLAANLVVNYTLSGSAVNGTDYNTLSGTVTILAGRAAVNVTVTPVNDVLLEGEETIIATLTSSAAYNVGVPGEAAIVVIDDEFTSVTLTASDATANEAGLGTGTFTFTRTGATTSALTVSYAINGTALNGLDYQPIAGSVVIPAGATTAVLTLTPIDDAVREVAESVRLVLLPSSEYTAGTTTPVIVTVQDNDSGLPGIGFTFATSSGPENDTSASLSVGLSAASASTVTVAYSVTGGSATGGGVDYTLASGTLSFAPDTINQSVTIAVNNDTLAETNETIRVTLSSPNGAQLDANASTVYSILDDDGSGSVSVAALDPTAFESGNTATFRITRSVAAASPVTVEYQVVGTASAPSDYVPILSSATIAGGSAFVDILITPIDDSTDETNETVVLNLVPGSGYRIGTEVATVTIIDNDDNTTLPVVEVVVADPEGSEPGTDTGSFVFTRTGPITDALTVQFTVGGTATSGSDYNAFGTVVIIPPNAPQITLVVTNRDDSIFEGNETLVLTLTQLESYLVGLTATATATIVDNEIGVSVAASGTASEDEASIGSFTFTRTGSTEFDLSVNFAVGGTASRPADYISFGNNVVIPAGQSTATVQLAPVNDAVPEGAETVVLTVVSGTGYTVTAPSTATLLLLDDEPAVSISATDADAYEGGANNGAFTVTRTGNSTSDLLVLINITGTAGNGVDYTLLGNSVTIQAGQMSRTVVVAPINDEETEGSETVEASLVADPAYAITAPASGRITIVDDEINLVPTVSITSPAADSISLAGTNSLLVLEASAADDGKPNPPAAVTTTWSRVSGPAPVIFEDSSAANTTVRFRMNGTYVLRITASDSLLESSAEVRVSVGVEQVLGTGLLAHWRMDERTGTTAFDSSPSLRNVQISGAAWGAGRFGSALDFDGLNDFAGFSSPALSQFTVSAWIQADGQGESTTPRILQMPGFNIRVRRDTASTTNAVSLESTRSTTSGEWRTPGNVVSDGSWYHVVVAYNSASTANAPLFYVNGVGQPATVRTTPVGAQVANTGSGYIGNTAAGDRTWDGRIDEVRIYNRLLDTNEVAALAGGPATNLAPVVDAGAPQSVPVAGEITLAGVVTDDGNPDPPGALTTLWSVVSGPGTVSFGDASLLDSTAAFSAGGIYVLRLTADDGQVKTADDVTINVIAPATVSIQAVDSAAGEFGLEGALAALGRFTLSRVGNVSTPLPVYLAISGTASNGMDYRTISNVVVMPANMASFSFFVGPLRDGLPEGQETVEITVLSDLSYVVGSPSSDTVYIDDAPWDQWRFDRFSASERLDPNISGELADPDLDGLRNLLEYALALEPKSADASSGFTGAFEMVPGLAGEYRAYVVRFHRRIDAGDLLYQVQVSTDLNIWISSPNVSREILPRQDDGNGVTETSRVEILGSSGPGQRSVRLKVQLQ